MPSIKRKRIPENPSMSISKRMRSMRRSTVGSLTRKVNKILSEQERKNLDATAAVVTVAVVPQIIQLNSIVQGDDATSRDGRKVSMVSSMMRYTVEGIAAGSSRGFRVIVVYDKQSNGVAAAAADVLTVPTNVRSPLTLDFKERFRVIHDNYTSLGKGDFDLNNSGGTAHIPGKYFFTFPDDLAQVEFGGIGNIPTSGGLFMYLLTEQANSFSYYHRLRFTDS